MNDALNFWTENILLWFVTPTLIFLFLVKPLVLIRGYFLLVSSRLTARYLAWRKPEAESFVVCAFPPFFSKRLRKGIWAESDTSFMFSRSSIYSMFVVCEEIKNEEEKRWVVPAFKRQMQNYLFLHHKPWLARFFDWLGFAGAFREGFGQFAVSAIRRTATGLEDESFVVSPKRVIGASFSERMPTPARKVNISFAQKLEIAQTEMKTVKENHTTRHFLRPKSLAMREIDWK